MRKDKVDAVLDYIIKHSKILFPVIVIAAVAITVSVGLSAGRARADQGEKENQERQEPAVLLARGPEEGQNVPEATSTPEPQPETVSDPLQAPLQMVAENVPLVANERPEIYSFVATYYNAWALGDSASLVDIYDELSEEDLLHYIELAKYLDYYPALEIYTKPGIEEGSTVAYVYYKLCFLNHEEEVPGFEVLYICDDGQGGLYIKNEKNFTMEEAEYITAVTEQDDAEELRNRVNAEFAELMESNVTLWQYVQEVLSQVDVAIGNALAEAAQEAEANQEGNQEEGGEGEPEGQEPEQPAGEVAGPMYAVATTTVNVRSSDSEQADKLGKISGGTRIEVQEVRLNGWSKVVFEGNDGYIKSEFLEMEEQAQGLEVIGTVTATTNVRARAAASLEAESLGILSGGESLELYAIENGWCKVNYNGRVAYVKEEFVTQE